MRLHDLRHSFASFLVNRGVSLYIVQGLLGHSQARATQRYAHLTSDTLLDAAEVIERSLYLAPTLQSLPRNIDRARRPMAADGTTILKPPSEVGLRQGPPERKMLRFLLS